MVAALGGASGFAGIFPRRVVIHGTIRRGLGRGQACKTGCYRRHSFHSWPTAANLRNFARGIVIQRTFSRPLYKRNQRNNVFYSALNYSCYRGHSSPPARCGPMLVCRRAGVVICSTISKILWARSRGASCCAAPLHPPHQPPHCKPDKTKNPAGCYSAHIFHKVPPKNPWNFPRPRLRKNIFSEIFRETVPSITTASPYCYSRHNSKTAAAAAQKFSAAVGVVIQRTICGKTYVLWPQGVVIPRILLCPAQFCGYSWHNGLVIPGTFGLLSGAQLYLISK